MAIACWYLHSRARSSVLNGISFIYASSSKLKLLAVAPRFKVSNKARVPSSRVIFFIVLVVVNFSSIISLSIGVPKSIINRKTDK